MSREDDSEQQITLDASPVKKRPKPRDVDEAQIAPAAQLLLNRELGQLEFNRRVLAQAANAEVPLLERVRFLCIVSSNLDEFFEIRAAPHLTAAQLGDSKGLYTAESFKA